MRRLGWGNTSIGADRRPSPASARKPRKKAKPEPDLAVPQGEASSDEDDLDLGLDDPEPSPETGPPSETDRQAERLGIDISTECPVCRSLDPDCDCEEEDRAFVRRTRFEADEKRVARCPRCQAPLSKLYLPRPGTRAPHRLAHFVVVHGCSVCDGSALATVAARRP